MRLFWIVAMGLGMILPFLEVYKIWNKDLETPINLLFPDETYELPQLNAAYEKVGVVHDFDLSKQYLGRENSIFGRYFLKETKHETENP